ncbi:LysE family translocator [Kytococcus sedentarius]|uniref:LysE family translocator n=1 Tax=Kytococcus sedentarius TaxID=1276 RepID=UPI0035BC7116
MGVLLPLAVVWTLGVMSPGPDFVAILRTAMRHGHRAASSTALGVVTGITVWIVLALVGLTALVQAAPVVGVAMRVAGAVFLVGYGALILWSVWRARRANRSLGESGAAEEPRADQHDGPEPSRASAPLTSGAAFRLGLATNVANPKALVFFGALFSSLLPPDMSWSTRGGILVMMLVIALVWFLALAWAASRPPLVRLYERAGHLIDAAAGAAFVVLGVVLLLE